MIVIGIGNNELEEVKKLFNPKSQFSSKGCEKSRNNIYFLSMKDCNYNSEILKNKCLKVLPMQIVEYYKINKTTPDNIREKNLDNIKASFKFIDTKNSLINNEPNDSAPPIYMEAPVPYMGASSYVDDPNNNIFNADKKNNYNNINLENKDNFVNNNIINSEKNNNDNNNELYEKPHLNINKDDKNIINNSNNYINGPIIMGQEKNDINMYKQNPYVQEKEKKYAETPDGNQNYKNNGYMSNPYIQIKKDNIINNNINNNHFFNNNINNNNYNNNYINNKSKIYNEHQKEKKIIKRAKNQIII